jgi:hypothetical protein
VWFGFGKCHAPTTPWRILHVFRPKTLFDGLLNPKIWEYPEITTAVPRGDLKAGVSISSRETTVAGGDLINSFFSASLRLERVGWEIVMRR